VHLLVYELYKRALFDVFYSTLNIEKKSVYIKTDGHSVTRFTPVYEIYFVPPSKHISIPSLMKRDQLIKNV